MPSIPPTMNTTPSVDMATSLIKRSSMSNPDKYPLYVFLIILGCVVGTLIGFSIYIMYHGLTTRTEPRMCHTSKESICVRADSGT
ncbi:unnamed protein product [Penicillium olsonii]|nr:unnamed protein product [Penicillium olsonii]